MGNIGKLIYSFGRFCLTSGFWEMNELVNRRLVSLGCSIGAIVIIRHEYGLDGPMSASSNRVLLGGKLVTRPRELNITSSLNVKKIGRRI